LIIIRKSNGSEENGGQPNFSRTAGGGEMGNSTCVGLLLFVKGLFFNIFPLSNQTNGETKPVCKKLLYGSRRQRYA